MSTENSSKFQVPGSRFQFPIRLVAVLVAVLLAMPAQGQDPAPSKIEVGLAKDGRLPVVATVPRPDAVVVRASMTRVERMWETENSIFHEMPSPRVQDTLKAAVKRGVATFHFDIPGAGIYLIEVRDDRERFAGLRFGVADLNQVFRRQDAEVDTLLKACAQAQRLVDVIRKIVQSQSRPDEAMREKYIQDASLGDAELRRLAWESDLSATVGHLSQIYFDLINCQIWNVPPKGGGGPGSMGEGGGKARPFLDETISIDDMVERITLARKILSREIRVSVASLLVELMTRVPEDVRAQGAFLTFVKESIPVMERATEKDPAFVEVFKKVTVTPASKDAAKAVPEAMQTLRTHLAEYLKENLRRN